MIIADTSAMVALLDGDDQHHEAVKRLYLEDRAAWLLPWAILPEVDYIAGTRLGERVLTAWLDDLVTGAYAVEWGRDSDLTDAQRLSRKYSALRMGLVDAVVMAVAGRLRADIATLDLRHFAAVRLTHGPRLLPRDVRLPPRRHRPA